MEWWSNGSLPSTRDGYGHGFVTGHIFTRAGGVLIPVLFPSEGRARCARGRVAACEGDGVHATGSPSY